MQLMKGNNKLKKKKRRTSCFVFTLMRSVSSTMMLSVAEAKSMIIGGFLGWDS